jgi:hypothetical protein
MNKKSIYSPAICLLLFSSLFLIQAENPQVGGHVKLTLYDYTMGERTYEEPDTVPQKADGARSAGMAFTRFTLYFVQEIKEIFSINIQPDFEAVTGATPSLGKSVGGDYTVSAPRFNGWQKAFLRIILPYPLLVEVSGGILFPRFSMDYGAELFWEEEYNGSKFTISSALGRMHATGIELYRNFELGAISLPVYLYVMNGSENLFRDNNDTPEGMIHIEPEMGPVKLFGSFLAGYYDDEGENKVFRWSGGASIDLGPFTFRSEYAGGLWEKSIENITQFERFYSDAKPLGFYAKLFYNYSSWGKVMVHYNYVKYNYAYSCLAGKAGEEEYSTITPGLQFNVFDCLGIQFQCDIGNWKRTVESFKKKDALTFYRFFLGLRATF